MLYLILGLLALWLVVTVLGAVIRGLVWLAILGGILFVATAVWGWVQNRQRS